MVHLFINIDQAVQGIIAKRNIWPLILTFNLGIKVKNSAEFLEVGYVFGPSLNKIGPAIS